MLKKLCACVWLINSDQRHFLDDQTIHRVLGLQGIGNKNPLVESLVGLASSERLKSG